MFSGLIRCISMVITPEILYKIAPKASLGYRKAFEMGNKYLEDFHVSDNVNRLACFLGQTMNETWDYSADIENLNYSPRGLQATWPSRFKPKGMLDPLEYTYNPTKLANAVYGGRLGNVNPNDGWKYRGRAFLNTTGRYNYALTTEMCRKINPNFPNLVEEPDRILDAEWRMLSAVAWWDAKKCNVPADSLDHIRLTKIIQGGSGGLKDRIVRTERALKILRTSPM